MNTLCNDPYIYTIDNFLTEKECKFIIKVSKDNLKLAGVSKMDNEKNLEPGKYKGRTNSSYWMAHDDYPETLKIAKKIAERIGCNYRHFENFQVIHYNENEEYKYHYDAYDMNETEKYKKFCKERGNRLRTVLVYLNDVEEGGGTGFDSLNEYDEEIIVEPKMGKMVVFNNVNDDGSLNRKSRHAGLPVIKGEKWAFNLWLRERERERE
jgi:prolyl 4-hydroxylase